MWGNSLGWSISAMLVVLMALGLYKLGKISEISPPTSFGLDEANLSAVALPIPPGQVVQMSDGVDATSMYHRAITEFSKTRDLYEHAASTRVAPESALPAIQILIDARHAGRARIFSDDPGQIVTYGEIPGLDSLAFLGKLAAHLALLSQGTDAPAATRYYEAEFALGAHLHDERLTVREFLSGVQLMSEAAAGMARIPDAGKSVHNLSLSTAFGQSWVGFYNQRIGPMLKVLDSIDPTTIAKHAGDIFYIARHAQERMWRVEAILALGRMRFFVGENGRAGDQRGANITLKRLADDPDIVIRRAATVACDLTLEQYRVLR